MIFITGVFIHVWKIGGALSSCETDSGHTTAVVPSTHKGRITQLVIYGFTVTITEHAATYMQMC